MTISKQYCPVCDEYYGELIPEMERHYWWHRLEKLASKEPTKATEVGAKPKGVTGTVYGVEIAHSSNVGDPREHVDPPHKCWCWNE